MTRTLVNTIGLGCFFVVLGACRHEAPSPDAATEIAAPQPADAPPSAPPGPSDDHSDGGERPAIEVEFVGGVTQGPTGARQVTLQLRNNTGSAQVLGYVLQVLDVAGSDVVTPIVVATSATVAPNSALPGQNVVLPTLPNGYHRLLVTAADPAGGSAGGGESFVHVVSGVPSLVTYADWYHNSGAERFGHPG